MPVIPVIEEEVEVPVISNYTLGGIFTRQDGSRTVWLNGNNINENNLPVNMRLLSSGGSSLLAIQLESGRFELRAGQTLDAVNGQVLESWQLPAIEQNVEIPGNSAGTIEGEGQADTQFLEPDATNLATLDAEQVDPLPALEVETLSISAEEIRSIVQDGFNVAFVPGDDEEMESTYQIFADGFRGDTDGFTSDARPVGLAQGIDGSLYISDSINGRVWKITYNKNLMQ